MMRWMICFALLLLAASCAINGSDTISPRGERETGIAAACPDPNIGFPLLYEVARLQIFQRGQDPRVALQSQPEGTHEEKDGGVGGTGVTNIALIRNSHPGLVPYLELLTSIARKYHADPAGSVEALDDLGDRFLVRAKVEPRRENEGCYRAAGVFYRLAYLRSGRLDLLDKLASLEEAQGNYAEAEALIKRAWDIRESLYGPRHPSVAESLLNYAGLLRATGRVKEAAEMEARAEAILANTL